MDIYQKKTYAFQELGKKNISYPQSIYGMGFGEGPARDI